MRLKIKFLLTLIIFILIESSAFPGRAQTIQRVDPAVAKLGRGFVSNTAKVNGAILHYVRGGTDPAVVLIHGFPQDWYEFHKIMPRLAKRFTVIAIDLRGVGGSAATSGGYDKVSISDIFSTSAHSTKKLSPRRMRRIMQTLMPPPRNCAPE